MIDKIHIQNFKSYADAELKLAPLTVLIGANASGKSNALEALRFLQLVSSGVTIDEIQYDIDQDEFFIRGNSMSLFRFGTTSFSFNCFLDNSSVSSLKVRFEIKDDHKISIAEESMVLEDGGPFYSTTKNESGKTTVQWFHDLNSEPGKTSVIEEVMVPLYYMMSTFPGGISTSEEEDSSHIVSAMAKDIVTSLNDITFLDPKPHFMRGYTYLTKNELRDDGGNLSAVLYYLWNEGKVEDKATLLSFISSLPEQDISGFDFLRGPRNEVMLQVIETFGGKERKVDAALLSDGTLRILAFAVSLLTAPKGSLVIIEEIDNGLHPSRADKLLETLRNVATKRGLSVLLSSHNPALLDALPDAAVPDVVFCYRNPETGDSELVKMADLDNYPELILQGSLGNLLTAGLIDRFVKNQKSKAERVEQGKAWLESVK